MSAHRFPLSKLSLAVTTALLTGPAALATSMTAQAQTLAPDSQWQCMPNAQGNGWDCGQVSRNPGPKMTAVRPAPKTDVHKPVSGSGTAIAAAGSATTTAGDDAAASTPGALAAVSSLDWVAREDMSEEQAARLAPFMSGDYIEPERAGIDFKGDPNGEPIHASADKSQYSGGNVAVLSGAVSVRQGYRQIESERAKLRQDTAEAEFEGNVVYREPGMLLVGDTAYVNSETGRLEVSNARYLAHGMRTRGEASELTRQEDQVVVLADGTYTTCKPGCNTWHLEGDTVELDPTSGRGEAYGATLNLADIPVFYFPYVNFPIDDRRHSGFLYPTFAFGGDNGFDYSQPYYINLAPNYDATVTPRLMTDRGLLLESEFRYLTEDSHGEIGGAYLYNDSLKDENRNYDDSRWFFNYRHQQELAQNWDAEIDFANASDKDYLRDFGTDLDSSAESSLNQQFITTYKGGDLDHLWQLTFNAQAFKNMDLDRDDPYEKLPQLEFAGLYNLSDRVNLNYLTDVTHFTRDSDWKYLSSYTDVNDATRYTYGKSDSNELSNADGTRMFLETGVDYNFEEAWGFVRPRLTLRHVQYSLSGMDRSAFGAGAGAGTANALLDYDTSPSTTVPMLSVDAGLYFDRETIWGERSMTQTLEPRMLYVLAPHEGGQEQNPLFDTTQPSFSYAALWRERRFSGYDRLGDANQISLGMESKFLEEDGFERLRLGVGQTFYFRDRDVLRDPYWGSDINDPDNDSNISEGRQRYLDDQNASTSPLASVLDYRIDPTLTWGNEWIYNTNAGRNDRFTTRLTWSPDEERVINAAYNYTNRVDRTKKDSDGNAIPGAYADGSISQTDLSMIWPVTNNWSAISRWNYDLTNSRNLELMFGGEREDDCYKLRVVWRTYVDAEDDIDNSETKNGVFVQFVLKGFGALGGGKVSDALEQVNGWERREEKRASY